MTGQHGFTLIELLIAIALTLVIGAVVANAVPSARAAFDRVPADLEMQQRGRAAIALLSRELRAADRITVGAPAADGSYAEMALVVPLPSGSQGVLVADQSAPGAALQLGTAPCPDIDDLCGFVVGASAMIASADGAFDVFIVASADRATRLLSPNRSLSRAYALGAIVKEVEAHTYRLAAQPDGSRSLIRVTAAGAVQPVIDFVSSASFWLDGNKAAVKLTIEAPIEPLRRAMGERVFSTSVAVRNRT